VPLDSGLVAFPCAFEIAVAATTAAPATTARAIPFKIDFLFVAGRKSSMRTFGQRSIKSLSDVHEEMAVGASVAFTDDQFYMQALTRTYLPYPQGKKFDHIASFQRQNPSILIGRLEGRAANGHYTGGGAMFDIANEIEILERYASECALISNLATDRRARHENGELASEYRQRAENLKWYAQLVSNEQTPS
jgi:hypothetical protein